jgi:3-oxoacyl-[acyl-carrier protein] reductase
MAEASLRGRLALVTGASRGIGRAVAERLLAQGAAVIGTGTRESGEVPAGCRYWPLRLEEAESLAAACALIEREAPQILVNNAGVSQPAAVERVSPEDLLRLHQINLFAATRLCQSAIPGMRRGGWGRIVNLTAGSASYGLPGRGNYGATKAALRAMTTTLAIEEGAHGILANCVAPGFTDTDVLRRLYSDEQRAALAARIPLKRLGTAEEVAALVAWLAGPENGYITGQEIFADGGFWRTRL